MNDNTNKSVGSGISFTTILFLVFLILKLCNVISWSWWWVTAPLWIPLAAGLVIFIVIMAVVIIREVIKDHKNHKFRGR